MAHTYLELLLKTITQTTTILRAGTLRSFKGLLIMITYFMIFVLDDLAVFMIPEFLRHLQYPRK